MSRFGRKIADPGNAQLHPGGQFIACNPGRQLPIAGVLVKVPLVHLLEQRSGGYVLIMTNSRREKVPDRLFGAEGCALKSSRQEAGAPVVRAGLRDSTRVGDGDECREVLILTAQSVSDP